MGIYKGYEQIEGGEPGHVSLLVRENVLDDYGMPTVDFDNLSRMYSDELGLQAGKWTVKLFHGRWSGHVDRPLSKLSLGYHIAGTNTIHSAVWHGGYHFSIGHGPEKIKRDETDTMRKLVRQSIGVAEGRTQKLMLARSRGTHLAAPAAVVGAVIAADAHVLVAAAAGSLAGGVSGGNYLNTTSARREAKEVQVYAGHHADIVFPTSPYS